MIIVYIATVLGAVVYASLAEWLLHRYMMHRTFFGFEYPYERHARIHHHVFKADETYHLQRDEDKWTIPMAWWNWIPLLIGAVLPFLPFAIIFHVWFIPIIVAIVGLMYYGLYESFHWCMHKPLIKRRLVEYSWIFYRLNGHHLLHHRYMGSNFNVVLPLWDFLLGTLMIRSKRPFNQARGHSVPDVQPIEVSKKRSLVFFETE